MPRATLLAASLALCLSACTGLPRCDGREALSVSEHLYFGTAKPTGTVTPQDWEGFLTNEVTPRFPAGLTAWQANGQWQEASGAITREASYVLNLLHPPSGEAESAVQALVAAYKQRFQQEAVLRVRSYTCVSL